MSISGNECILIQRHLNEVIDLLDEAQQRLCTVFENGELDLNMYDDSNEVLGKMISRFNLIHNENVARELR